MRDSLSAVSFGSLSTRSRVWRALKRVDGGTDLQGQATLGASKRVTILGDG